MKTAQKGITGGLIKIPILTKPQQLAMKQLSAQEGYKIICKAITGTVNENNARLVNWTFSSGDEPEATLNKATQYGELRKQNDLLKSFLMFLKNTESFTSAHEANIFESQEAYE